MTLRCFTLETFRNDSSVQWLAQDAPTGGEIAERSNLKEPALALEDLKVIRTKRTSD